MKPTALFVFTLLFVISCGGNKKETDPAQTETTSQASSSPEAEAVEQATFTDLEGNMVDLSEYKGKVVLIDFWETWCKPCLQSFPTMQNLMEEFPEKFVVLAVTPGFTNSVEDAREFAEEHEYDFVYLYDENKLHQKLNVQGIPFKVFVDAEGNFIESSLGSRGPKGDYEHTKNIIQEHS